jgi:ribonucleoside-diphosphate reductase alpha chain
MELPTQYQTYIHLSRYARWLEADNRRETWDESVDRYFDFFQEHIKKNNNYDIAKERKALRKSVINLETMPSMRALMTAGPALEKSNVAGYNCSYVVIDHPRAFDETLYVLMCGTGVGFSVEHKYTKKLPEVPEELHHSDTTIKIADSKLGWAVAFKELINLLYAGTIPKFDDSAVRPAGARLMTFGGRASGPGPLIELFQFTIETFRRACGRRLTPLECHDVVCKVGDVVVVGGVRRAALISLSDIEDTHMRQAKAGNWYMSEPQRQLANNSAVYEGKPDVGVFLEEWSSLYNSKSGERGIFNREAAIAQAGKNKRRLLETTSGLAYLFGTNPCGEILLRPQGFCNLSEVVARAGDTVAVLLRKIRNAVALGAMQSTLTNFKYLRKVWKNNAEEERLLGVSITGIADCPLLNNVSEKTAKLLDSLREEAIREARKWSKKLNINLSAAITCVKPSGTVSQLTDTASGIHNRHAPFYIRRVRNDKKDPVTAFMVAQGFPYEDCVFKPNDTTIFSFPMKAPVGALTRDSETAIESLEKWLMYKNHYTEHNPSITVTVGEEEWPAVGAWIWENFDEVTGVAFLPRDDHVYQQAPYEEITEDQYNDLLKTMPENVNWLGLTEYEKEDTTTGTQELACVAGVCEL